MTMTTFKSNNSNNRDSSNSRVNQLAEWVRKNTTPEERQVLRQKYVEDHTSATNEGYIGKPVNFIRERMHFDLTPDQEMICEAFEKYPKTLVASGHGLGKCVGENEPIPLADGSVIAAKYLVSREFEVPAYNQSSGHISPSKGIASVNGIRDTYRVTTKTGRSIVRTGNHPLLTWDGWRPIDDLAPGVKVAVPKRLPIQNISDTLSDTEVKLIAYMIGDGGMTGPS